MRNRKVTIVSKTGGNINVDYLQRITPINNIYLNTSEVCMLINDERLEVYENGVLLTPLSAPNRQQLQKTIIDNNLPSIKLKGHTQVVKNKVKKSFNKKNKLGIDFK